MYKKIILLINITLCVSIIKAQDINFSQFYELPLLRNPALAGLYKGDIRATAAMRSQWSSVTVPYSSQALSIDTKFSFPRNSDNYLAMGLQITNDVAGDSKLGKTQVLPILTFHKSLSSENDTYLSIGFLGGPVLQRFDPTKLKFDDQFVNGTYSSANPTQQTFSSSQRTYWDATVGLAFSKTLGNDLSFYLGASYSHFTRPKVAFDRQSDILLNRKYVLNMGLSVPTSDYDKVVVYTDYFIQGGNSQFQGGFIYKHDIIQTDVDESISISGGMFLRWDDAFIPLIKLDYYKFGVGITYDANISKLRSASHLRGGFEITFSYKDFLNMNNDLANKTRCPVNVNY